MSSLSTDLPERTGTSTPVEVRGDARLAIGIGAVASVVAIAYLARAVGGGSWLDWALVVVTGAIAAAHLQSLVDARVPLLVVDDQGVRLRKGRTWHGLPWEEIECLEVEPRRGLRDGRVVLVPLDQDVDPVAVPLSVSTRVLGADGDLAGALAVLAGDPERVVDLGAVPVEDLTDEQDDLHELDELDGDLLVLHEDLDEAEETPGRLRDPRPAIARGISGLAERLRLRSAPEDLPDDEQTDEQTDGLVDEQDDEHGDADRPEPTVPIMPIVASATPLPLRDTVVGVRSEVRFDGAAALQADPADDERATARVPEADELRRPDPGVQLEDTQWWQDDALLAEVPLVDDLAPEPAPDPVIGPQIAAARTRLALSVDALAERTRIRPHVIESIEVDDFAPCGGDFYARGHLRTLARVVGLEAAPLLEAYDERYADAPIDARRVFEAELATSEGGPIRSTRGGPNWSILVAAVMAVVLAWSIARLVMDSPVELQSRPVLNGSPSSTKLGPAVPVVLDAASGGSHVVVRDGAGQIVFNGDLAFGETRTVKAAPPVRVFASDGGLQLTVDGTERGALGTTGQPAQNTFAAE